MSAQELMKVLIEEFPNNLIDSHRIFENHNFKNTYNQISSVVVCGLGGSGIGGKLVQKWTEKDIHIPFLVCQDYELPQFVDSNTLLIISSYSGNT